VGSKQAYGLLAEKYCPGVYWNCRPVFWCYCVRLCCHRYRTVEIPSFAKGVTKLLIGFRRVRKIAKSFMCPSVCAFAWNDLAPTWRILTKFYICGAFENPSRKLKFH
jgi:hypothetical protein